MIINTVGFTLGSHFSEHKWLGKARSWIDFIGAPVLICKAGLPTLLQHSRFPSENDVFPGLFALYVDCRAQVKNRQEQNIMTNRIK